MGVGGKGIQKNRHKIATKHDINTAQYSAAPMFSAALSKVDRLHSSLWLQRRIRDPEFPH